MSGARENIERVANAFGLRVCQMKALTVQPLRVGDMDQRINNEIGRHLSNNAGKQGRAMRASPVWNSVQRDTQ